MPLLCLSLCDLELKNAPEKNNNAFIKLKIFLKTHFIQINWLKIETDGCSAGERGP
jgi:hypothetical protein